MYATTHIRCVDVAVVREKGVSEETVAAAVRLASVIHAVGAVVEAELALAPSEPVAVGQ